jgi:hypothetical protein
MENYEALPELGGDYYCTHPLRCSNDIRALRGRAFERHDEYKVGKEGEFEYEHDVDFLETNAGRKYRTIVKDTLWGDSGEDEGTIFNNEADVNEWSRVVQRKRAAKGRELRDVGLRLFPENVNTNQHCCGMNYTDECLNGREAEFYIDPRLALDYLPCLRSIAVSEKANRKISRVVGDEVVDRRVSTRSKRKKNGGTTHYFVKRDLLEDTAEAFEVGDKLLALVLAHG